METGERAHRQSDRERGRDVGSECPSVRSATKLLGTASECADGAIEGGGLGGMGALFILGSFKVSAPMPLGAVDRQSAPTPPDTWTPASSALSSPPPVSAGQLRPIAACAR